MLFLSLSFISQLTLYSESLIQYEVSSRRCRLPMSTSSSSYQELELHVVYTDSSLRCVSELIDRLPILCRCFRLSLFCFKQNYIYNSHVSYMYIFPFTFLNMEMNLSTQNSYRTSMFQKCYSVTLTLIRESLLFV